MKRWAARVGLLWALVALPSAAAATELVADLSDHLVAITTGFTGSRVLLFGATEGAGDVAVVVRGPSISQIVRRKARIAGVWVNDAEMIFEGVPAFYAYASTRPAAEFVSESVAARHEIGVDHVRMRAPDTAPADEVAAFRAALTRNKQRAGLFADAPAKVSFLGNRLFRTDVHLPANAPVGIYQVQVFLVREGEVVSANITPLVVSKIGFEAGVSDFARRHALPYGVLAILVAGVAGWLASVVFRRA